MPRTHLLRAIDRFSDLGEMRDHLAAFYSHTGRPSIEQELIRMLIVGYCFGIRSERRPEARSKLTSLKRLLGSDANWR